MLVRELADKCSFNLFCGDGEKEVTSFYCCDLLSNALVRLNDGAVWLTVMNNVNVSAIAYNNNVACVILTEDITPDDDMLKTAIKHGVTVLGCELDTYNTVTVLQKANLGFQIN